VPGPSTSSQAPDRGPAELRDKFLQCMRKLLRLVDEEGADILLYSDEADDEIEFLRQNAALFKDEIRRVCLERGGNFDPLVKRLRSILPEEDRNAIVNKLDERLEALVSQHERGSLQRSYALLQLSQDSSQPIGLRIDALLYLGLDRKTREPPLVGKVLSLLDSVHEPILRTKLYWLLVRGDAHPIVTRAALEKAIDAIERGTEHRGTTAEIVDVLAVVFQHEIFTGLRGEYQSRLDNALVARLRSEGGKEHPDDALLAKIAYAAANRTTIPSSDHIAAAREMLRSGATANIRSTAAAFLLPDLRARGDDPAARAFIVESKEIFLPILRKEKDEVLTATILFGLGQFPDPDMKRVFDELGRERPDLRESLEHYAPKGEAADDE
jgi:flagellar biosynthesis regulator FlaF